MSSDIYLRTLSRPTEPAEPAEPAAVHLDLRRICSNLEGEAFDPAPVPLTTLPRKLDTPLDTPLDSPSAFNSPTTPSSPKLNAPLESPSASEVEGGLGRLPALPDADADVFASLPPVDRGRHAWTFLAAATVMETIVWGLPFSVGVLHAFWVREMFPGQEGTLTLAATLMNGLLLIAAGLFAPIMALGAHYTTYIQLVGLVAGTLSLVCSAFVTEAWHLIITLGLGYPLSMLMWLPIATYLYEWFHARRGLAFGILCSGAAVGGTAFPLMGEALLKGVGYRGTMYTLGGFFGVSNAIAMCFVKRRIPLPSRASRLASPASAWPKLNYSFLRQRGVYIMSAWVLFLSMASFLPSLWMPTFAQEISGAGGRLSVNGTTLVAIMYSCSFVGNILTGWLVDRIQPRLVAFAGCAVAGIAALLLWGFGTNDGILIGFAVVWGLTALCSASVWGRMIHHIAKDDHHTLPGMVTSLMITLRGVGNFVSGPLSTALLQSGALKGAVGAYKTNYGAMLVFTGTVTFVGGVMGGGFPKV